jgi:hypothetical protein
MMKADTRELKKLERTLLDLNRRALPFATQQTVNDLAFKSQGQWRQDLPGRMKLRNRFTVQSIRVEKSRGLSIAAQQSTVGSDAEYMDEQELGAVEAKKGKHGVPIPAAAPGARSTRGRVPKRLQFGSLTILPHVKGHRSRQVAAALSMAAKRGGPQYAFLQLKRGRSGIYQLDPSKKKLAVRKVWDVSKASITIPKNPTMGPAVVKTLPSGAETYRRALTFQLNRMGMQGSL